MKKIQATEDFYGYPPPEGKKRYFPNGEVTEVDDAYADLLVEKGQARMMADAAPSEVAPAQEQPHGPL